MGKPIGQVEYAFQSNLSVLLNQAIRMPEQGVQYEHRVSIAYQLQDAERNPIEGYPMRRCVHSETTEAMLTVDELIAWLHNNLRSWIRQDKLELSGFDIGEPQ